VSQNRWRFEILAMTDPQALSRVVGYFAQRSIVPEEMSMRVACGVMHIAILTADLPAAQAQIIAAKLVELFVIFEVKLESVDLITQH
jgi:hypothetical protein